MKLFLAILVLGFVASGFASEAADVVGSTVPVVWGPAPGAGPVWSPPLAILFDNGPFVTDEGIGPGGADVSMMEPSDGTYGFGASQSNNIMVAEDFEVPAGETWNVESITIFSYQTGSSTTPTINGFYMAVYDDFPATGSIVYGNMSQNAFTGAVFTNCYRVLNGQPTNNQRPIMAVTAEFGTDFTLTEGTYWLCYTLTGTLSSGPWVNPVAIKGQTVTGDAWQYYQNAWNPIIDTGSNANKGLPFIIEGSTTALERASWGAIKASF